MSKLTPYQKRDERFAWAFLVPCSIYMFIFSFFSLAFVIVISFTSWKGLDFAQIRFIGFENYVTFFTDTTYLRSLLNTIIMGGLILVFNMVLGFFLALLLNKVRGKGAFRVILYIPGIISFAVLSEIIARMLEPTGILNIILDSLGADIIFWTESTFWMFFYVVLLSVWRSVGNTVLYYLAGLAGINKELYEAADLDGANAAQKMIYVTIPQLKPMIFFILITSLINMFNIFEPIQLITKGGPNNTTMVVMYQIYNEAFQNFNMGMSSAISVIVMLLVLALTALNFNRFSIGDEDGKK